MRELGFFVTSRRIPDAARVAAVRDRGELVGELELGLVERPASSAAAAIAASLWS